MAIRRKFSPSSFTVHVDPDPFMTAQRNLWPQSLQWLTTFLTQFPPCLEQYSSSVHVRWSPPTPAQETELQFTAARIQQMHEIFNYAATTGAVIVPSMYQLKDGIVSCAIQLGHVVPQWGSARAQLVIDVDITVRLLDIIEAADAGDLVAQELANDLFTWASDYDDTVDTAWWDALVDELVDRAGRNA